MAKIHVEEAFECPDCEHREQHLDSFKCLVFLCDNCDSGFYKESEAIACCPIDEEELEEEE